MARLSPPPCPLISEFSSSSILESCSCISPWFALLSISPKLPPPKSPIWPVPSPLPCSIPPDSPNPPEPPDSPDSPCPLSPASEPLSLLASSLEVDSDDESFSLLFSSEFVSWFVESLSELDSCCSPRSKSNPIAS